MVREAAAGFGYPEQWARFAKSRKPFLDRLPRLLELSGKMLNRRWSTDSSTERVVYQTGNLCLEDFREILLLACNGFGFGALKIVRGMFERLVTAQYLHLHPDVRNRYLNFHLISDYKLAREMSTNGLGPEDFSEAGLAEKKRLRDSVKADYMRPCPTKDCVRTIEGYSWSPLDVISMAQKCGPGVRELVAIAYYIPMSHTHPTVQSLLARMESGENSITHDSSKSAEWSERAVSVAHNMMLRVLELQLKQFPELKELTPAFDQCVEDYYPSWNAKPS